MKRAALLLLACWHLGLPARASQCGACPSNCSLHEPLYPAVNYFLEPWLGGITEQHLDAAKDAHENELYRYRDLQKDERFSSYLEQPSTLKFPFANLTLPPDHPDYPWSSILLVKVVIIDGQPYLPSGHIPPHWTGDGFGSRCYRHGLVELLKLSKLVRLPDMTLLIAGGDVPFVTGVGHNGLIPPIFSTSSAKGAYDIVLPDCYAVCNELRFEPDFLSAVDADQQPFQDKLDRVVARSTLTCPYHAVLDRRNEKMWCPRASLHNLTQDDSANADGLIDVGLVSQTDAYPEFITGKGREPLPRLTLVEQFKYKYSLIIDGISIASRTPLILAAKQVPLYLAGSTILAFYTQALQPWVHWVPTARDSFEDVFSTVAWLNAHPAASQRIAEASSTFARTHLVEAGRLCYMHHLLTSYAELLRFETGPLAKYPKAVTLEDALKHLMARVHEQHMIGR